MRKHDEAGETLIEIVIALVVMGAVVSAMLAAIATSAAASKAHRDAVTADAVLRDYAEATKTAVRSSCTSSGSTYSVAYAPPSGFKVNTVSSQTCPAVTVVSAVTLTVTLPSGKQKSLLIDVRSP